MLFRSDVEVFPESINKKTFHGSLTHGIVCNMSHALNNYQFDYFLVISSREFFYRTLNDTSEIEKHIVNENTLQIGNVDYRFPLFYKAGRYCDAYGDHVSWLDATDEMDLWNLWWWPKFSGTKLYQHIKNNNMSYLIYKAKKPQMRSSQPQLGIV